MIQEATASLIVAITTKIIGKAIQPTLKMVRLDLVWTEPYILRLPKFYDFHGQRITLSLPTTQAASEQTYSITYPGSLANYQSIISFSNGQQNNIETINAEDEWVGATISGPGIQADTTITAVSFVRLEDSGPITMTCSTTFSMIKTTQVKVNIASLGIPWVEGQNYAIEVGESFVIDANPDSKFGSPAKTVAYTANPPLAIVSSNPTNGEGATRNNDYITMTFNRNVKPYIGNNIYVYKRVGAVDTLIKTFPTTSGIINQNVVTLDVRGLITPSTDYFVTSDDELFKDNDNFVYNSLTGNLSYTTINDAGFKHLISLEFTFANMAVTGRRTLAWTPTSVTALVSKVFNVRRIVNPSLTGANRFAATATLSKTLMGKRQNPGAKILSSAFTVPAIIVLKTRYGVAAVSSFFTAIINIGLKKGTSLAAQSQFNITANATRAIRANASLTSLFQTSITGTELFEVIKNPYSITIDTKFGNSFDFNNSYLLAGAASGTGFPGKVFLFNPTNQQLLYTFNNTGSAEGYGQTVKLSPSYAFIVSYETGVFGKVEVFNLNDYSLKYSFTNPNPNTSSGDDQYGYTSIAANDSYLAVSAPEEDVGAGNNGIVYIYELATGSLQYTIQPPTNFTSQEFGQQVAISGNYIAISSGYTQYQTTGVVYVYNLTTGSLVWTINSPNTGLGFGWNIAMSGNKLAISEPGYPQPNANSPYTIYNNAGISQKGYVKSGIVYVYNLDNQQLEYSVEPTFLQTQWDPNSGIEFGGGNNNGTRAIAFDDKHLIIGARRITNGNLHGRAYFYSSTNGQFLGSVDNSIGGGDFFGTSVGVNNSQYAVSAPWDNTFYGGINGGVIKLYLLETFSSLNDFTKLKPKITQLVLPNYNVASNTALLNSTVTVTSTSRRFRNPSSQILSSTATLTATAKERLVPFFATTSSQATLVCDAIKTQITDMVLDYLVPTNATGNGLTVRIEFRGPTKLNFNWSDGTSSSIDAPTNGNSTSLYVNKVLTPGQAISLVITPIDAGAITASEMSIRGDGAQFAPNALRRIYSFGSVRPTQLYIRGNNNLLQVPSSIPSSIIAMEIGNLQLNDPAISAWNVSNIQSFANFFQGARDFNQPLNSWNVAGRSEFGQMFEQAQSFNQPLNNWNVAAANSFGGMFRYAFAFNQDISGWRPVNLLSTGMRGMFYQNTVFNQDLRGWCVTNITSEPIGTPSATYALGGSTSWINKPIWGTCP